MIKEALEQLETSTELSKRSILNKDLLLPGLVTFLLILPSVLFWYLWMVQSVEVFLDLKSQGNDVWGLYPGAHISILIGLSGLVLFISLFSKKAQKVNKFALLAMSLFGSILVILFLPKGYGWIGLLLLAIAMVYYWLTPWHSIRSQWLPLSKKTQNPEVMQAVILTLTESITKLPYPLIREAVLPLLDELLSLSNEYRAKKSPDLELFEEFVQALSEHIQPVLGALSYRAKSLDNDTTALMVFMERFPPFPAQDRARFNSVESYRNTVLSNQIARDISQAMWLKSALIVADNSPNTLADTLFDIELMLMPILLKNTDEYKHEVALIMLRFVERLENKENKLNVFQQNSWLKLLEMLVALSKSQSGDILLLSSVFKKLSFTQNSFSEGTFQYSAEREKQLQNLLKQISQLINEEKGSILTAESTLSKLLDSHPVVFLEFSRLIPRETLAQFLVIMPRPLVDKFYQFYEQKLGKSIIEEYEPVKQQYRNQVNEQLVLNQVVQYLKAANRVIGLLFEQSQEIENTNFINEEARYETEFENRLNYAVLKRVDEVSDEIQSILLELKNDIESQGLDLSEFINHLGYKFGALIFTLNRLAPNEIFEWFILIADNETSVIDSESLKYNYFLSILYQNIVFHHALYKEDQQKAFEALNQLQMLLLIRYPLNREACEATLVTCMQMVATLELDESIIETWFKCVQSQPEDLYPLLTVKQKQDMNEVIQLGIVKFDLLKLDKLSNQQKMGLSDFLMDAEDQLSR